MPRFAFRDRIVLELVERFVSGSLCTPAFPQLKKSHGSGKRGLRGFHGSGRPLRSHPSFFVFKTIPPHQPRLKGGNGGQGHPSILYLYPSIAIPKTKSCSTGREPDTPGHAEPINTRRYIQNELKRQPNRISGKSQAASSPAPYQMAPAIATHSPALYPTTVWVTECEIGLAPACVCVRC